MAAHTFWRFDFRYSVGSSIVSVSELALRESIGGTNVTPGATLYPILSLDPALYPPASVIDGDTDGDPFWASSGQPCAFILQLAAPADVVEFSVSSRSTALEQSPGSIQLSYADSLLGGFRAVHLVDGLPGWTAGLTRTYTVNPATVRTNMTLAPTSGLPGIPGTLTTYRYAVAGRYSLVNPIDSTVIDTGPGIWEETAGGGGGGTATQRFSTWVGH
jgi:hypothetical protein